MRLDFRSEAGLEIRVNQLEFISGEASRQTLQDMARSQQEPVIANFEDKGGKGECLYLAFSVARVVEFLNRTCQAHQMAAEVPKRLSDDRVIAFRNVARHLSFLVVESVRAP